MVQNCRRCGAVFNSLNGGRLCPACVREDDEVFLTVKEFIYENPRATISEVASGLNISITRIKRYLREGRLEIIEKHNLFLECERCGVAIQTGRFCPACMDEFFKDLKKGGDEPVKKKDEKQEERVGYYFKESVRKT